MSCTRNFYVISISQKRGLLIKIRFHNLHNALLKPLLQSILAWRNMVQATWSISYQCSWTFY